MLTHDNFVSNIIAISNGLPISSSDRSLAVLPLSHIFERTVFYVLCANGVSIHYCASFDQLASHLQEVKPTIMTAVPRLFEQVYHKIVKKGKAGRRLENKALRLVARRRAGILGSERQARIRLARCSPQNTLLPTGLSFQNGGRASAELCGSLFRAAHRCRKNSPMRFGRREFRSFRATA